jgi:hypothetical protein
MISRRQLLPALVALLTITGLPAVLHAQRERAKAGPAGPKLSPTAVYEGLLGRYGNDDKPIPFVTLAVPNGSNILSDEVLGKMRGKISIGEISYVGTGYFSIPADGTYEFDSNLWEIKVNGREMGFNRKLGTIDLKKGVYQIQVKSSNHGGPYLETATLTIRAAGSPDNIPIFNSGKDIQRLLSTPVAGFKPIVTHDFDPEAALLDIKLPKR